MLVGGIALIFQEGNRPAATPVATTYAAALAGHGNGPPLRIVDAAPSAQSWLEIETVRGHVNRTSWRALRRAGENGPDVLFQSTWMVTQNDGSMRPLGSDRVGWVKPMDDWTAGQLRAAGFMVAAKPLRLETWTPGSDSIDASMPGYLTALLGFSVTILAAVVVVRYRLQKSSVPDGRAKRLRAQ